MKKIASVIKHFLAIFEIMILAFLQRSLLSRLRTLAFPIKLGIRIIASPFMMIKYNMSKGDGISLRSRMLKIMTILSAVSWMLYFFLQIKGTGTLGVLSKRLNLFQPVNSYFSNMNSWALSCISGNLQWTLIGIMVAFIPVFGLIVHIAYALLVMVCIAIVFFLGGITHFPVITAVWLVAFAGFIVETMHQLICFRYTWIRDWFEFEFGDANSHNSKMGDRLAEYLVCLSYYIPIINVLVYKKMMALDKKYLVYRTKPSGTTWTDFDFLGCYNKIHSKLLT